MSQQKGRLIVLEGLEGAGVEESLQLVAESLRACGEEVLLFSFPQYGTKTGRMIDEILTGVYGNPFHFTPEMMALFYANNRAAVRPEIEEALQADITVLVGRYVDCNRAYQAARSVPGEQEGVIEHIRELEYERFCMPLPSRVIFLDAPPLAALQKSVREGHIHSYLTGMRAASTEEKITFLQSVYSIYQKLSQAEKWGVIAVFEKDGTPRDQEKVISDILDVIKQVD